MEACELLAQVTATVDYLPRHRRCARRRSGVVGLPSAGRRAGIAPRSRPHHRGRTWNRAGRRGDVPVRAGLCLSHRVTCDRGMAARRRRPRRRARVDVDRARSRSTERGARGCGALRSLDIARAPHRWPSRFAGRDRPSERAGSVKHCCGATSAHPAAASFAAFVDPLPDRRADILERVESFFAAARPELGRSGRVVRIGSRWAWERSACCLWYQTESGFKCEDCSLWTPADRAPRYAAMAIEDAAP